MSKYKRQSETPSQQNLNPKIQNFLKHFSLKINTAEIKINKRTEWDKRKKN